MLEFPAGCCNERVSAAQCSGDARRALMDELATYAYQYPLRKLPSLDEDVSGDFYLFCHDKLELMIDQFEERGIPFEHYVNSVLSWQLRSFLNKRKQVEQVWQNGLYSQAWGSADSFARRQRTFDPARAPAPPRLRPRSATPPAARPRAPALRLADPAAVPRAARPARRARPRRFRLPNEPIKRRVVFAVLKTAHLLDERQFAALAAATGCHPDGLRRLVRQLERRREPARRRREMLRERRNLAFADFHIWSAAAYLEPEPPARARAVARAARHRYTMTAAQAELARVRLAPSNRDIAALLGVPKGTVDTGLYWLRRNETARYLCGNGVGAGQQQPAQGHRGAPHPGRHRGADSRRTGGGVRLRGDRHHLR